VALARRTGAALARAEPALALLRRPDVDYELLTALPGLGPAVSDPDIAAQVDVQARYHGYLERQQREVERLRGQEEAPLPQDLDYAGVQGLSAEVREKLLRHRPRTVGQASRISGVTPAAVSLLLVHLKKRRAIGAP